MQELQDAVLARSECGSRTKQTQHGTVEACKHRVVRTHGERKRRTD